MLQSQRLKGVHPDLVAVVNRAAELCEVEFTIAEGVRLLSRQKYLFSIGKSKTMNSRHLTGHAVDLIPINDGKMLEDWPSYHKIEDAMKTAAQELETPIEWGGDWKSFVDGPHWQLPWADYP